MFDVVIKNGIVVDGVVGEPYRADIGVVGDAIAAIEPTIDSGRAARIVDADGCFVTPGFIDVHSHSDYYLMMDPRAHSRLLQGVTTEIGGNCGYAAAPHDGDTLAARAKDYREQFGLDVSWRSAGEYFDLLAQRKPGINFGLLIGYNTVRGSVMGHADRPPTVDEMERIKATVDRALAEGAFGMSVGVVYPPACFADVDEFADVFRVVADHDKIFTSHIRSEGEGLIEALAEVVEIARRSGCRLQVSHLKTAGKANWGKLDDAFALLEEAQADGVELMADRYPYLASNTGLSVVLPDEAFEGGRDKLLERLADATIRATFTKDILRRHPEPAYWGSVMVSQVVTPKNRDLEGLTVVEGAALRGKDPFTFVYDLLLEERSNVEAIYFVMSAANMDRIYAKPWVMVGSDSGARNIDGPLAIGRPHPRTFGSYPRFWREYVREREIFTPAEAVRKMATAPADFFRIPDRGRLAVGKKADAAVFDPARFTDKATFTAPLAYPEGLRATLVNGRVAVDKGVVADIGAGAVLTQ
jgi:N-acyl-D-amino-acid deacylase